MKLSRKSFESIVRDTLEDIPEPFSGMLENVAIVVEEEPSGEALGHLDLTDGDELFGLYQGTPLTEREAAPMALPDRVFIYRGPILRSCRSSREVAREIRETVIHELGHHFGLSDEEMIF